MYELVRISAAVPEVSVGNIELNTENIIRLLRAAEKENTDITVFPQLSLSGCTCQDLFFQNSLVSSCSKGIVDIVKSCKNVAVFGSVVKIDGLLYNCAVVTGFGKILGIVPKANLTKEENRWFSSTDTIKTNKISSLDLGIGEEYEIPVGNIVFELDGVKFAAEINEDLLHPFSQGKCAALAGAEVVLNLAAVKSVAGADETYETLVKAASLTGNCGYVLVSAGANESTTDFVFSGDVIVASRGKTVNKISGIMSGEELTVCDLDIGKIRADRIRNNFSCMSDKFINDIEYAVIPKAKIKCDGKYYQVSKNPFIPEDETKKNKRIEKIYKTQVAGLKKRLKITGAKPVVGVSGGLDSTLALLVCYGAVRELGRPVSDIVGITMPCFGTSGRTHDNSLHLMELLGITWKEINIENACLSHFADIGHDPENYNTTYENAQARERTQVLMDYAGEIGGLVVGTGDLSELALGWCTYNADHMSMYGVNGGIPKTLVSEMIKTLAETEDFKCCREVLCDIAGTPISPELLPPDSDGNIAQVTEDLVGPYALHDFFIYYILRFGFEPSKVYFLAKKAFDGEYDDKTIKKWLENFYRRFFTQQFKRSCLPDGVKIGSVGISPRGDLLMPSDAVSKLWLDEVSKL